VSLKAPIYLAQRLLLFSARNNAMLTLAPKAPPQSDHRVGEILARGLAHHQAGHLAEAEVCYREVLRIEPDHAEALHLLGVLAQQNGDYAQSERLIRSAIARNTRSADHHNNLGNTYRLQGDLARAVSSYREAIAIDASHIEALHSLANSLADRGDFAEAESCFRDLLRLQPDFTDAHYNLGNAKLNQGNAAVAIECYRRAIDLQPGWAAYHFNLAHALQRLGRLAEAADTYRQVVAIAPDDFEATYNLGIVLHELKEFAQAADAFRQALVLKPDLPQAMSNLAAALQGLDDYSGAADLLRRAIALNPDFAEAHGNWGGHLWRQGDLDGAKKSCLRAIELNPNLPGAHGNLGHLLFDQGDYRGALDSYDHSLALKPDAIHSANSAAVANAKTKSRPWQRVDLLNAFDACHRTGHDFATAEYRRALATKSNCVELLYYVGLLHLLHGDFAAGWHNYEYRWQTKMLRNARRDFSQPQWLGQPIAGARILLHAEQGLGDTLQFIRYVPMVAARGAKIILEVPSELRRLVETTLGSIAQVITRGSHLPDFDWQSPLLSLPFVFQTAQTSIPASIPYLQTDPQLARSFAQHFGAPANIELRVGLVWSGSPRHTRDPQRSIPLAQLCALTEISDTTFYSLQKGPAAKDLLNMPIDMNLVDLSGYLNDFADTAAALAHLDLVITVDTAVAHLAGALGKRVWILLTRNPDWRWLLDREDSPWYPTARLFRQHVAGDWSSVIDRVHTELHQLISAKPKNSASHRTLHN
jgi:tetratricopeptide (TPR) repeat protein